MTSIEEKIAKLLRLAENNPSEEEAARAAEKAQTLMLEHGIELANISLETKERIRVDREEFRGKLDPWRRMLAAEVARASGGDVLYALDYRKWSGRLEFYGPYGTIKGIIALYLYLEAQVERISAVAAANYAYSLGFDNAAHSMRWRRSYMFGMTSRLVGRLQARAEMREYNPRALTIVKDAVQTRMEEDYETITRKSVNVDYDEDAAIEGYKAGASVNLGEGELQQKTKEYLES